MESSLRNEVELTVPMGAALFERLAAESRDGPGVTRAPYSPAEQAAHDAVVDMAHGIGLETRIDHAGNSFMTLPGRDRDAPAVITGSHLDSVLRGGNYDGAAGVVGGLAALAALSVYGFKPERDITVMGIRGEETAWFSGYHIGSRAALGVLPAEELDTATRQDTGRSLADHMADAGFDPDAVRRGEASIDAKRVAAYLEMHIEQGPVLEAESFPVGVVSGIRGNVRARNARCTGAPAHAGAAPRRLRRDAVMAAAEFVGALESDWEAMEAEGRDLVLTLGKLFTDPASHSHNKVPELVHFSIEARSHEQTTLDTILETARRHAGAIGGRRNVTFDLGDITSEPPAPMDPGLQDMLREGCAALAIPHMTLASGGGHDAGDFAQAGVPTAMIFLRNPHGSHNPDEAMEMADFALGTTLLAWTMMRLAG